MIQARRHACTQPPTHLVLRCSQGESQKHWPRWRWWKCWASEPLLRGSRQALRRWRSTRMCTQGVANPWHHWAHAPATSCAAAWMSPRHVARGGDGYARHVSPKVLLAGGNTHWCQARSTRSARSVIYIWRHTQTPQKCALPVRQTWASGSVSAQRCTTLAPPAHVTARQQHTMASQAPPQTYKPQGGDADDGEAGGTCTNGLVAWG